MCAWLRKFSANRRLTGKCVYEQLLAFSAVANEMGPTHAFPSLITSVWTCMPADNRIVEPVRPLCTCTDIQESAATTRVQIATLTSRFESTEGAQKESSDHGLLEFPAIALPTEHVRTPREQ